MKMIEKIIGAIERMGWTQRALEVRVGLSENRISKWKDGKGEPTARQALAIARALELPLEYLVDDDQEEPTAASSWRSAEEQMVLSHYRVQARREAEAGPERARDWGPDEMAWRIAIPRQTVANEVKGAAGTPAPYQSHGSAKGKG